jgi:DNA polymerase III delta prime subunit
LNLNCLAGGLPYAISARFDCNDKLHPCHEGTRTTILNKIHQWVDQIDPLDETELGADIVPATCVFWLNGPGSAGTGKTTIAYTVARDLHKQQKLGASFFCSRDNAECRDPKLIFPTIAYQLGHFYTPFYERVSAVLKADPEVAYSVVPLQLERLIVQPLQALQGVMPPCVIVIDALDECQDGGATSIILSSLAQHIMQLMPLKFLITSRPDIMFLVASSWPI